jgi:hypothetical protein
MPFVGPRNGDEESLARSAQLIGQDLRCIDKAAGNLPHKPAGVSSAQAFTCKRSTIAHFPTPHLICSHVTPEYNRVPIEVANCMHTEFDHPTPSFLICLPIYTLQFEIGPGILAPTRGSLLRCADPQSGILFCSFGGPYTLSTS